MNKMNVTQSIIQNSLEMAAERAQAQGLVPASEKQIKFLASLAAKGKINSNKVAYGDDYTLPKHRASELISEALGN
jgi:hypothetical protein